MASSDALMRPEPTDFLLARCSIGAERVLARAPPAPDSTLSSAGSADMADEASSAPEPHLRDCSQGQLPWSLRGLRANLSRRQGNVAAGTAWLAERNVDKAARASDERSETGKASRLPDRKAFPQDQLHDLLSAGAHGTVCELALIIDIVVNHVEMPIE
jgi:hypothetical protein